MSSGSSCVSGSLYFEKITPTVFVETYFKLQNKKFLSGVSNGSTSSGTSGMSSTSPGSKSSVESLTGSHRHHESCGSNCLGAIPRNTQYTQQQFCNSKRSAHHYTNKGRLNELQNRLPPIKEFRSPTKVPMPSPAHIITNPKLRYVLVLHVPLR